MTYRHSVFVATNIIGNEEKQRNEQRLQHSGRIPYLTFQLLIGVFYAVTLLAFTGRTIVRIRTRRFGLDDYFVIFAFIALSGATGLTLKCTRVLFFLEAMTRNPAYIFTTEDQRDLPSVFHIIQSFVPLTWTATFAVKLSFLALFRQLIKRVSKKITIYIWVVIVSTVLTWAFALTEPFISCPYMNEPRRCETSFSSRRMLILDVTLVSLNMATDVMIIIVPILILRLSQMKLTQKVGVAALLCLSIFMVLISAIRMTGYAHSDGLTDLTWSYFWLYLESCVAIIMASISALGPFFFNSSGPRDKADQKEKNKDSSHLDQEQVLQKNKNHNRAGTVETGRKGLPVAHLATLTQFHRFLYDDTRLTEGTETTPSTNNSTDDEN